jgi:hypothetical protein
MVSGALAQASGDRFEGVRARPVGPLREIGGVGYIAPEGWQVTQQGAAAVLIGPSNYLRSNDKFQLLFHSLQLPGFTQETGDLAKQLVGSWQSTSSSAGVAVIFAANGHFDDVGAVGSYHVTNLGQLIYETQSTWPGNGSYRVAGDRLTMSRNGAASETTLFSILRRPKPNGRHDQILRIVEPAKFGPAWGSATPATT